MQVQGLVLQYGPSQILGNCAGGGSNEYRHPAGYNRIV